MAYINGTYVAFSGKDTTNPTESDIRYYNLMKAWKENDRIDFQFSDSHIKTYQVKDDSNKKTLEVRLMERMRSSKQMILIITKDTEWDRSMLNFEIEKAVDLYKIPLIIVYPDYNIIQEPIKLSNMWPRALKERINDRKANCIHMPAKKEIILDAISQFDVHTNKLKGSLNYYSDVAYRGWGLK